VVVGAPRIGILSVQGAFEAHGQALRGLGARTVPVRTPGDLVDLDGLVLPGGESTAMSLLLRSNGLWDALGDLVRTGLPTLATCAGVILLAAEVIDGRDDQSSLAAVDVAVRRNGFGRQVHSFEADLPLAGSDDPLRGVFIRAPVIERVGAGVEVLASLRHGGVPTPVLCREKNVVVATFHPELTTDGRVHQLAFGPGLGTAAEPAAPRGAGAGWAGT
jgi:pyridoxal 5'-phosphate synthase pdxT subunit